jgi:hypothetical protein
MRVDKAKARFREMSVNDHMWCRAPARVCESQLGPARVCES